MLERLKEKIGNTALRLKKESLMFYDEDAGQSITDLPAYAVILGVIAIVAGLSVKILSSMKANESDANVNATLDKGITAVDTLTDWLDDIALVIAAVIILGLIMGMLYLVSVFRSGGGGGKGKGP